MEATREWTKQENAIPAWVADKACSALRQRVSTIELSTLSTIRVTTLSKDGDDAESDTALPGAYYLRVRFLFLPDISLLTMYRMGINQL
jgi:hypothetical protein